MIKAIVMDMDGTLLDSQNHILPQTKEKLLELQKKGIRLILASGRSYTRLLPYASELEMDQHDGILLEVDGIATYDLGQQKRHVWRTMEPEEIGPVFDWLTSQDAETQAVFDDGLFDYFPEHIRRIKEEERKKEKVEEDFPWTGGPWGWLSDLRNGYPDIHYVENASQISRPVNKLQIMNEEEKLQKLYQDLKKKFGDSFEIYRTTPRQLEVLPRGYGKGQTLARIMAEEGWKPEEVVAFGDGENDVSMFETAGHSFAMGNAQKFIQEQAEAVTDTNNENGIKKALEGMGL